MGHRRGLGLAGAPSLTPSPAPREAPAPFHGLGPGVGVATDDDANEDTSPFSGWRPKKNGSLSWKRKTLLFT